MPALDLAEIASRRVRQHAVHVLDERRDEPHREPLLLQLRRERGVQVHGPAGHRALTRREPAPLAHARRVGPHEAVGR
eukprot:973374-Prymnesium_polylepis.1